MDKRKPWKIGNLAKVVKESRTLLSNAYMNVIWINNKFSQLDSLQMYIIISYYFCLQIQTDHYITILSPIHQELVFFLMVTFVHLPHKFEYSSHYSTFSKAYDKPKQEQ